MFYQIFMTFLKEKFQIYQIVKNDGRRIYMVLKKPGRFGGLFAKKADMDKSSYESQVKVKLIKNVLPEGITEASGADRVLKMANDNSFGKLAGKTIDAMSANLFKQVYEKTNDKTRERINSMNEKQLYIFLTKLWTKFGKQVKI